MEEKQALICFTEPHLPYRRRRNKKTHPPPTTACLRKDEIVRYRNEINLAFSLVCGSGMPPSWETNRGNIRLTCHAQQPGLLLLLAVDDEAICAGYFQCTHTCGGL